MHIYVQKQATVRDLCDCLCNASCAIQTDGEDSPFVQHEILLLVLKSQFREAFHTMQ